LGGESYDIDDPVVLGSIDSEALIVSVTPDDDPDNVPRGHYLIQITVESDCGGEHIDTLSAQIDLFDLIDDQISILENMEDVPEKAEVHISKAVDRLENASEEFENKDWETGFSLIERVVKELMNARKKNASTYEVIDELMYMTRCIIYRALIDVESMVGEDNEHIEEAWAEYEEAFEELEDGKYDKFIFSLSKAFDEIMKARTNWIPEDYVEDLEDSLDDIGDLIESEPPKKALKNLENAEEKIEDAIQYAEEGEMEASLEKLDDVIQHLQNAYNNGADTDDIIDDLLENIKEAVKLKIEDAEKVRGTDDTNVKKAWEYYDSAIEEWDDEEFTKAVKDFKLAVQKAELALTKD